MKDFCDEYFVLLNDGWLRSIGQHRDISVAQKYADYVSEKEDRMNLLVISGDEAVQWADLINSFRPNNFKFDRRFSQFDERFFNRDLFSAAS